MRWASKSRRLRASQRVRPSDLPASMESDEQIEVFKPPFPRFRFAMPTQNHASSLIARPPIRLFVLLSRSDSVTASRTDHVLRVANFVTPG